MPGSALSTRGPGVSVWLVGRWGAEQWNVTDTRLGHGGFANVFKAIGPEESQVAAAKIIDLPRAKAKNAEQGSMSCSATEEIQSLKLAQAHKHVVGFMGAARRGSKLLIFQELVAGGDLLDRLLSERPEGLPEAEVCRIVTQLLNALTHLHSKRICHGDLKPENILCSTTEPIDIKLADFGSATVLPKRGSSSQPHHSRAIGTHLYSAPEVLQGLPNDFASDMWSVGAVVYVLLSGNFPFSCIDDVVHRRASFGEQVWESVSVAARHFVERLLVHEPAQRPSAAEALNDIWITRTQLMTTHKGLLSATIAGHFPKEESSTESTESSLVNQGKQTRTHDAQQAKLSFRKKLRVHERHASRSVAASCGAAIACRSYKVVDDAVAETNCVRVQLPFVI
eukprot:CAMPEP_0119342988 /NCGR_PEP_ID=MMETSP1333-20130426/105878_1 /TAXON_ID=418940 /ORGANISM="Scyphosphaera apsteinii, Strain RCC1455" /LENGTH=394 /DNA_ID=CAMNT_0007355321 /DNA_START=50 /DNA_END=1234 /DNA_ORIENTATION=+